MADRRTSSYPHNLGPSLLFVTWLRDARQLPELTGGELAIALALSLRWGDPAPGLHPWAFERGLYVAWPSIATLAGETGRTRRAVQRASEQLAGKLARSGVVERLEGRLSLRSKVRGWVWTFDRAKAVSAIEGAQVAPTGGQAATFWRPQQTRGSVADDTGAVDDAGGVADDTPGAYSTTPQGRSARHPRGVADYAQTDSGTDQEPTRNRSPRASAREPASGSNQRDRADGQNQAPPPSAPRLPLCDDPGLSGPVTRQTDRSANTGPPRAFRREIMSPDAVADGIRELTRRKAPKRIAKKGEPHG